jgi:hypothetical protein
MIWAASETSPNFRCRSSSVGMQNNVTVSAGQGKQFHECFLGLAQALISLYARYPCILSMQRYIVDLQETKICGRKERKSRERL